MRPRDPRPGGDPSRESPKDPSDKGRMVRAHAKTDEDERRMTSARVLVYFSVSHSYVPVPDQLTIRLPAVPQVHLSFRSRQLRCTCQQVPRVYNVSNISYSLSLSF
jgi:hypothetical protein